MFGDIRDVVELEILTLGIDEKWRYVGIVPRPVWFFYEKIYVNGAIHWMDCENPSSVVRINSFNIATEEAKILPAPPGLENSTSSWTLAELGNCLCLIDIIAFDPFDIWWMKEYGIAESWIKDRIHGNGIPAAIRCVTLAPFIIWKDGEMLMQTDSDGIRLVSYSQKRISTEGSRFMVMAVHVVYIFQPFTRSRPSWGTTFKSHMFIRRLR
ncbi:hypothetical protein P3S67_030248 [Capsicum chacoense]